MAKVRNILFIMCDQLRWDYLGCTGHPFIQTPHIDALAARGLLFTQAYCQSPVCGPSRMSFYTGRYMTSHGSTWNNVPLSLAVHTLGDYLRPMGVKVALVGKTHMKADTAGMQRLGVAADSEAGGQVIECGFDAYERDDGLHPDQWLDPDLAYNRYLRGHGFTGDNPWHEWANSAVDENGALLSGWYLRHADKPARVPEAHSETAYMTDRAMAFISAQGDQPWCLHLSYIKPHWPYMAPAPYHAAYGADDVVPAIAKETAGAGRHPVVEAFRNHTDSLNFAQEKVRRHVIPTYMGLVKQVDDHLGRLLAHLQAVGRSEDTMIVFTSDHGDYLGDYGLGEKELMHDAAARIPLLIYDPRAPANASRGRREDRLVESIDLIPTFLQALGAEEIPHTLEGRSLQPLLYDDSGENGELDWRDAVFSEAEYACRKARLELGLSPQQARIYMIRTAQWKYLLYEGFRPQLFDLTQDPTEIVDLGDDPNYASVSAELHERLFAWLRSRVVRTTMSDKVMAQRTGKAAERGYIIGTW